MTAVRQTGTYLDRIIALTAEKIEADKRGIPGHAMVGKARFAAAAVPVSLQRDTLTVIAEFKRASPSKGRFPVEVSAEEVAESYIAGGAAVISCLTDEPFFQGSLADLRAVVRTSAGRVPVLRKDFTIDAYQIDQARANGASMILLIVACLSDSQLREYREHAESMGMQALVEVHDEGEAERAVASGVRIIGINNRDLRSFHTDLGVTERIAPQLPKRVIIVGESGIHTLADAQRMAAAGADAILVGESLILQADRASAVRNLASVRRA
jgi:indole-3-glycerol phosphate synthase